MSSALRERNDSLAILVRHGDAQARNDLIAENRPLVFKLVNEFLAINSDLRWLEDDMEGDGFVALVEAVNRIAEGIETEYTTAFLAEYIRRAIHSTADANAGIGMKPRTARERRAEGKPILQSQSFEDGFGIDVSSNDNHEPVVDLRDAIYSVATTDAERQLLTMFEQGDNPAEIAEALGRSLSWVYDTRKRLYGEFLNRHPEYATGDE